MKRLIERIVDLVYSPEEDVPFRWKLVAFIALVLIVVFAFLIGR